MSKAAVSKPRRNVTRERVDRLSQAVAELMESHTSQGQAILKRLDGIEATLVTLAIHMRELASGHALLGTRVEDAFARAAQALRTDIRLDVQDKQ